MINTGLSGDILDHLGESMTNYFNGSSIIILGIAPNRLQVEVLNELPDSFNKLCISRKIAVEVPIQGNILTSRNFYNSSDLSL